MVLFLSIVRSIKETSKITYSYLIKKKYISYQLPVCVNPLSANHPFSRHFTFNFPWSLGAVGKLNFTPVFVWSQHTALRNIKILSGYQFTSWSSGTLEIHFLCSEKFTLASVGFETRTSRSAVERATTGPTRTDIVVKIEKYISTD